MTTVDSLPAMTKELGDKPSVTFVRKCFERLGCFVMSLGLIALLTACQSVAPQLAADTQQLPVAGARIKLIQPIPVSADSARSIVQHGVVTQRPDLYATWCTFHLHRTHGDLGKATQIQAGEFQVLKTWLHRESSYLPDVGNTSASIAASEPTRDAESVAIGAGLRGFRRWNADVSNVTFSTMMEVKSVKNQGIHRIVCSVFDDPSWDHYPMLSDIREALGEYVHIDDSLKPDS